MTNVGTSSVDAQGIGVLEIDSPPVNALGVDVRRALHDGLGELVTDESVTAIVLICGGRTFFAGADIRELGKPVLPPFLHQVFDLIEASPKPIIAAIHGTALGGGYELALVCHYRIAVPSAKVGFPEVKLGLLPGAGGTQRLPRIIGVETALDIISAGDPIGAEQALRLGMVDALAGEGALRADAIAFAARLVAEQRPLLRVRDRQDLVEQARGKPEIYRDFLDRHAAAFRGFRAPVAIAEAIEAAAELPFDQGYACEQRLSGELLASIEAAAQQYYFFAERAAAKSVGMDRLLARGEGSIVDRLLGCLTDQARTLVAKGVTPQQIDRALFDFGFPAGLLANRLPEASGATAKIPDLLGALLYPVVNEGAKLLEEGAASPASNIDVAAIRSCGWPVYRGGPMFWADSQGLDKIVAGLEAIGLRAAPSLAEKAKAGQKLTAA